MNISFYDKNLIVMAAKESGIRKLLDTAIKLKKELDSRVDTSAFNDALRQWCEKHEAPRGKDGHYKVLYGTQVSSAPVRFLLFVNRIKGFPETYVSYIKNMIQSTFGFKDIPVEISLRERRRNPSLYKNGPGKDELEVKRLMNEGKEKKRKEAKGNRGSVGNKAKVDKARKKAEKVVREKKTKTGGR